MNDSHATSRSQRVSLRFIVGAAVAVVTAWLWVCWCVFPTAIWNDVRLAPAFALARGRPMYPTETTGVVTTWMYGPLPAVLLWPATWAASAAHALLIAGAVNIFISLAAISAVCALWPAPTGKNLTATDRLLATVLVVALWSELGFQYLQADNVAIAVGLVANLILVRAHSPAGRWAAAACAVAALACKQTSLGVAAAQIVWLGVALGRREALRHLVRCVILGLITGGAMVAAFGWENIRFTLLLIPSRIPWIYVPGRRLFDLGPSLYIYLFVPAAVLLICRRTVWRRDSVLLLPSLTWLLAIPAGMAAVMKLGGSINSLQSFPLWLPPALLTAVAALKNRYGHRELRLAAGLALLTLALVGLRLAQMPSIPWRPITERYRQAEYLARTFPGQIWFPWNPLVTLYSENRYYHDEDGIYVRFVSGRPISTAHAYADLPPHLCVIALPGGNISWGLVRSLMPPGARRTEFGLWTLYSWTPAK